MSNKEYRSVSQLNLLTDCGAKFELERLLEVPPRPAAWTARGIAIHEAILEWEKSNRSLDLIQLALDLYDHEISRLRVVQPDEKQWMITPRVKTIEADIKYRREDLKTQCEGYLLHCESAGWIIPTIDGQLMAEVPFELEVQGIPIRGSIDAILWWPEEELITIRDIKSGGERKKNYQLGIYRFAAQKILGLDIDYGEYYYTKLKENKNSERLGRSSGLISLKRYDEKYVGYLFQTANQIIQQKLFLPSPGKDCELCPVQKYCPEMGWETCQKK